MVKIDLCIDPFFLGMETSEKIRKVKKLGFEAIEFWYWDHEFNGKDLIPCKKNIGEISSVCNDLNVMITDLVVNSPDGEIGGSLTKPEDMAKYLERLKETIDIAHKLNCKKLITCTGNELKGRSFQQQYDSVVQTLSQASEIACKEGITLVTEALNSKVDHPGYFLTSSEIGFDIVKTVNSPGLKLLYDIYHMQIMGGNQIATIKENISLIGHFHSASVPGRNELYSGEINYTSIINAINDSGYDGYFGLEYWPTEQDEISLSKTFEYLKNLNK
ncbi:MAG: TIM barrel protein [Bacteroidales bacterium]|nr:TIM barrel protein [Bacteroidales bacterium]